MQVLSNYVLLKNPYFGKKESVIQLTETAQQEAMIAEMSKCKELTVSEAGIGCQKVAKGDKVYVDMDRVLSALRVTKTNPETKEEEDFFIIRESDIIFIY